MSIKRDLALGSSGELLVLDIFKKADIDSGLVGDKATRSFYDLYCHLNNEKKFIEVKNDIYATRSGNIAIEIYNPKSCKPSGISITKSDFWVHILNTKDVYICKTETLKAFVNKVKPRRVISVGGDGNSSMVLYTIEDIIDVIFTNISDLEPSKLTEKLIDIYGTDTRRTTTAS